MVEPKSTKASEDEHPPGSAGPDNGTTGGRPHEPAVGTDTRTKEKTEDSFPPEPPSQLITKGGGSTLRQNLSTFSSTAYQNFSVIMEANDAMFWTSLVNSISAIPPFIFLAAGCTNAAFGLVFSFATEASLEKTSYADVFHGLYSVAAKLFIFRNLLASFYELTIDIVAGYPMLNPTLLSRMRMVVSKYPRMLAQNLYFLHAYFACYMVVACDIGVKHGPLPRELLLSRFLFVVNYFVKVYLGVAFVRRKPHETSLPRLQRLRLRQRRHWAVLYAGFSDLIIFLVYVLIYELENFVLERKYDLELRVMAFIFLEWVLINTVKLGLYTYYVLIHGVKLLERQHWNDFLAREGYISLMILGALAVISLSLYGFMPAFFILVVVYVSLPISRYILWFSYEAVRVTFALMDLRAQFPPYAMAASIAFLAATLRDVREVLFVLTVAFCTLFAVKVRKRLFSPWDLWVGMFVGFGTFLLVHHALYTTFSSQINNIFTIAVSDTALNISSVLGTSMLTLSPPTQHTHTRTPTRPRYPFCHHRVEGGLNMLDMAFFSQLSYHKNNTQYFDDLLAYTIGDDWEVMHDSSGVAGPKGAVFLDLYSESRNMSIISVRGTNPKNLYDIFQDMAVFCNAFLWDLTGLFVPTLQLLPDQWTSLIVYMSYLPLEARLTRDKGTPIHAFYHDEVQNYTARIAQERKVILTGHSLGGGIAKIVGSRLRIPVFAISSPGIALSHRIFGSRPEDIYETETTLLLSKDIVPKFDRLLGLIMQMKCPSNNPLICHQLGVTICELVNNCGLQLSSGKAAGRVLSCDTV